MPSPVAPVLLKLSGEALKGEEGVFDPVVLQRVAGELLEGVRGGRRVALVVGGGNIVRGRDIAAVVATRTRGDYMGMLATLINSLALREAIESAGGTCEVVAPHAVPNVAVAYDRTQVLRWLAEGVIVIFGGGTGHPFFTTDTTAALRAAEIDASELLKGSNVDGIYTADPGRDPDAQRIDHLSFDEAVDSAYGVMDQAAFSLCRDRGVRIRVFDMTRQGAIRAALGDNPPGTTVG
ncbi:MAG: uridine monophosphate kinase [Planctomycetota bacterium]